MKHLVHHFIRVGSDSVDGVVPPNQRFNGHDFIDILVSDGAGRTAYLDNSGVREFIEMYRDVDFGDAKGGMLPPSDPLPL